MTRKTKPKEKYLYYDIDRHGNQRWYYCRKGAPKIRIRAEYGTEEFELELTKAKLGIIEKKPVSYKKLPAEGSFKWLVDQYMTRALKSHAPATRAQKRRVLHHICEETCLSKSGQKLGDMNFKGLQKKHITILRDQKGDKPEAANHRKRALSTLFNWAIDVGLAETNPAEHVKKVANNSGGHHTVTEAEIEQYLDRHHVGTKAHLAMQILRYTGLRISDVARLGRKNLYTIATPDGPQLMFKITPKKSSKLQKTPVTIDLPVLPPLAEALSRVEHGHNIFLVTRTGEPYTVKGFGNRMRSWFDMAGLPHCSAHGIRKAGAVIAAESGATASQLLSMFGWTKLEQAELYTRMAQRKILGKEGARHLLKSAQKSE
ncbi:tyrosine-type recombinase/integrase [Flexibacterium corallicola]|uniref:tyrosine-type recombinase/integrase n=1 Tax=Flexibacterium corallicola TaxID=3037259 RepID=UPI00286EE71F|nr:tyrosine-type recombinase/integrase [Pseudovibrio sp. M1P-2-3]